MKTETNREIAERIAEALFTNGMNDKADRLVLMYEQAPWSREAPRNLGGWSKSGAISAIEAALRGSKD